MRGKVSLRGRYRIFSRITPAYAGKRASPAYWSPRNRDHPRLCGEKTASRYKPLKSKGSPPPMRGKAAKKNSERRRNRITPAYAGKRQNHQPQRFSEQDHPRLCGEKRKLSRLLIFSLGSPPPMRGKAMHRKFQSPADGITPAYAGKRTRMGTRNSSVAGSPPPMRGKAGKDGADGKSA